MHERGHVTAVQRAQTPLSARVVADRQRESAGAVWVTPITRKRGAECLIGEQHASAPGLDHLPHLGRVGVDEPHELVAERADEVGHDLAVAARAPDEVALTKGRRSTERRRWHVRPPARGTAPRSPSRAA